MKRLSTFILAFVLLLSLAACGGETTVESNTNSSGNNNDTSSLQNKNTGDDENNNKGIDKNQISFTEIVAVDNEECIIKITGIDPDYLWGYTLNVQLENKSVEKTYMYSVESASINGVQCEPLFASEVSAGKKSNDKIVFSDSKLEENDVGDYTDIELIFRVYDSNDWMADEVARESIHIYPYGEDKAVRFVREPQQTDNVIVDNENVTVIVTGYEDDIIWGYTVNLFLMNKTDKDIMFSVDEASVNGYMADPFYATEVAAGKSAFSSMSWSDTILEANNISAIEEIEFKFRAYDSNNWFDDDFINEVVTLKP